MAETLVRSVRGWRSASAVDLLADALSGFNVQVRVARGGGAGLTTLVFADDATLMHDPLGPFAVDPRSVPRNSLVTRGIP
ncbi:hypothetical protein ACFPIJ_11950 [Dactylosporangium cerinum]|uniref:Uncharacterized protein n=1 Tax=Dactylosporangium cerinum TaxID=1434730 RepID=A0ABV9VQ98_9ACTN